MTCKNKKMLWRNAREQGVRTRSMKIVTIIWCNDEPLTQGLSEALRGKKVSCIFFKSLIRRRGALRGRRVYRYWGVLGGVSTPNHQT